MLSQAAGDTLYRDPKLRGMVLRGPVTPCLPEGHGAGLPTGVAPVLPLRVPCAPCITGPSWQEAAWIPVLESQLCHLLPQDLGKCVSPRAPFSPSTADVGKDDSYAGLFQVGVREGTRHLPAHRRPLVGRPRGGLSLAWALATGHPFQSFVLRHRLRHVVAWAAGMQHLGACLASLAPPACFWS